MATIVVNSILTHAPLIAVQLSYQLSYQANWELVIC